MDFEWDGQKARRNARKHGIQFADAVLVLEDDNALTESMHLDPFWLWSIRGGRVQ